MDADEDFAAGRQVDVHFRDLDDVEHRLAEARQGRFGIEMLTFHLAGIPPIWWSASWRRTGAVRPPLLAVIRQCRSA
jgi:hypothetical protein